MSSTALKSKSANDLGVHRWWALMSMCSLRPYPECGCKKP